MPMEKKDYRNILELILIFNDQKQVLNISAVVNFTGLDRRTVVKRFPFTHNTIAAATLARCMCPNDSR